MTISNNFQEETILQRINKIKQLQGSNDFDATIELLKITSQEIFNNFEELVKDKSQTIEILNNTILFLLAELEYYKSVYFEFLKKDFEKNFVQYVLKFITFLPHRIQDTFNHYKQNPVFNFLFK
ncbi:hypothetical protein C2G38_2196744 [Gigaspora rosea]|uniref:Uncharacterized protein n=1 Tax=Gigaspora rosea TaxID=44941 RepID=A0A397UYL7_9GLOM|nr:hypothetical protein C2G38_2196744 [Gigaspora rosea]